MAELTPLEELQKRIRDRALGVSAPAAPSVAPPAQQSDSAVKLRDLQARIRERRIPTAPPEERAPWKDDLAAGGLAAQQGFVALTEVSPGIQKVQNAEAFGSVPARTAQSEAWREEAAALAAEMGNMPEEGREALQDEINLLGQRAADADVSATTPSARSYQGGLDDAADYGRQQIASGALKIGGLADRMAEYPSDPRAANVLGAEGFFEAIKEFTTNGWAAAGVTTREAFLRSLPAMAPTIVASVAGTATMGPAGGGAAAGSVSAATEYGMSVSQGLTEKLQEAGVDMDDEAAVMQALDENPAMLDGVLRDAGERAISIGAFDALGARIAGGLTAPAPLGLATSTARRGSTAARVSGGAAAEGVTAGLGETTAQLATEGEITEGGGILGEIIGQTAGGVPQAAGQMVAQRNGGATGDGGPGDGGTELDPQAALETAADNAALETQRAAEEEAAAEAEQQAAVVQDRAVRETRLDYAPTFASEADFIKQREAQLRADVVTEGSDVAAAYREFLLTQDVLPSNDKETAAAVNAFVKSVEASLPKDALRTEYRAALDEHIAAVQTLEAAVGVPQAVEAVARSEPTQQAPVAEGETQVAEAPVDEANVAPAQTATAAVAATETSSASQLAQTLVENTGAILDADKKAALDAQIAAIEALPVEERSAAVREVLKQYTSPEAKIQKTASTAPKVREYTPDTPTRGRDDAKLKADALLPEGWIESADTRFEDVQGVVNGEKFSKAKFDKAMAKALAPAEPEVAVQAKEELLAGTEIANIPTPKGLSKNQSTVWDIVRDAFTNNEIDTVIQPDGSWNFTKIQELAGLKSRQAAQSAIKQIQPKIAKAFNMTPKQVKQELAGTAKSRQSAQPVETLNDATEVFDKAELASGMGTVASVNQGAKTGVDAEDAAFTAARSEEPNVIAEKRAAEATARTRATDERIVAKNSKELSALYNSTKTDGTPAFADLPVEAKIDWMRSVAEWLQADKETRDEVLAQDQRDIERQNVPAEAEAITDEGDKTAGAATEADVENQRPAAGNDTGKPRVDPERVEDAEVVAETPAKAKAKAEPASIEGDVVTAQPDTGVVGVAKTPTVEVKKKKKITKPPAAKFSVNEIEAEMKGTDAGIVARNIRQAVGWLIGKDSDWRVTVVRNPNDMIGMVMAGEVDIDSTQLGDILDAKSPFGVVVETRSGVTRAFFFAENIAPGTEHAVVMHEVGSHMGMDAVLTKEQKTAAVKKIKDWAVSSGTSLEKRIAEKAISRVDLAVDRDVIGGETADEIAANMQAEYIAYFLEEAVLHGVTPTSDKASALRDFVRGLWADFKRALRKLRPADIDAMTAQDMVNMARGAARLELGTRAHGGAHDFRAADPRFFGLGNNANGIGFYVSEEHNLAYDYMTKRAKERGAEEGTLLRVDVTVDDADMMVWGDTLENQPAALAAFDAMSQELQESVLRESRIAGAKALTGRQFYTGIAAAQIRDQLVSDHISQADFDRAMALDRGNARAMSMASSLLNDLGVKGIRTAVSNPTTLANPTFNNIIFDADNVVIVGRNAESDTTAQTTRSGTTRFGINESSKQSASRLQEWTASNLGVTAVQNIDDTKSVFNAVTDAIKPISLFIRDNAKKVPALERWYDAVLGAKQTRRAYTNVVDEIANRARALKPQRLALVNDFLSTSTFYQKWGYDPQIEGKDVKVDPIMKKKFERLTAQEQQVVKDIFNQGEVLRNDMNDIAKELGVNKVFELNSKLDGPYAPLKRFGDKVVVLKSQTFLDAEKEAKANSADGNTKALEKLKSNPKHYVVQYFDTMGSAKKFERANQASFAETYTSEKAPDSSARNQNSSAAYQKVIAALNAGDSSKLDAKSKAAAKALVEDLLFQSLDERSARLSGARRMNIAGFEKNMIRSFVSHGRSQASLIAQMKHGTEINMALIDAQQQVRDAKNTERGDLQRALNVILFKNADLMTPRSGLLAEIENQVLAFNTTMMLSTSLGYHVTNRIQPIYSVAKISSDFGRPDSVWAALFNGNKVARNVIETSFMRQAATVVVMGLKDLNNKISVDINKAPEKYRTLLNEMQLRDLLDVGVEEDLNLDNRKDTGYSSLNALREGYANITHRLYQTSRYVEASNRVSSAVAAYDMAQKNPAMLKKMDMTAQEYAINVVQDTQGDFSAEETSLVFSKLPRVTTQFRKYQVMMGFLHARAFKSAIDKRLQPWEIAAARRLSAYLIGTTGMLAGAIGIPGANLAVTVFSMVMGDEDEPDDLERAIRDNIDDPQIATLAARGLPAMLGLDMSTKMAMNDIFSAWDSRYSSPSTDKGDFNSWALNLAFGPTVGNANSVLNGVRYLQDGDPYRGVESMLPKGGRTMMESYRLSTDGFTDRKGVVVSPPSEFSLFDLISNASGIPSTEVSNLKWTYYQQFEIEQWFSTRKSRIKQDYLRAYDDGDKEGMREATDAFNGLQDGMDNLRPFFGTDRTALRRQSASVLRRAVMDRRREERQVQSRADTE